MACRKCVASGGMEFVSAETGLDSARSKMPHGGRLILIVGPSGAGKDTLIAWLKDRLGGNPDIRFVTRTVTRDADIASEAHDSLSGEEFTRAERAGAFAVTWQAHGHRYGLPSSASEHVASGGIAIANGSRRNLGEIAAAFDHVVLVNVTVDPGELHRRLLARGREDETAIARRLQEAGIPLATDLPIINLDNSGRVETAGGRLLEIIGRNLDA